MTTTTDTDDPFADEEEQEVVPSYLRDDGMCLRLTKGEQEKAVQFLREYFKPREQLFPPVPARPLSVAEQQAELQAKRIAELEARIESMERDRQVQAVCTTLLQMVVSGDLTYYLTGPGQDKLEALHKITQDASEGMRHLVAQEREAKP